MGAFRVAFVLLLVPRGLAAHDTTAAARPLGALTAGIGVSYAGIGFEGELYLGGPRWSALVGIGGVPYYGLSGVSGAVRYYLGRSSRRVYFEATAASLSEDGSGDFYGPAVLVGYSSVSAGGFTLNLSGGGGRRVDGSPGVAFNLGLGYTWRRHR